MAFLRIYSASAYVKGCERITMNVYSFHHAEDYCTAVSETRIQRYSSTVSIQSVFSFYGAED